MGLMGASWLARRLWRIVVLVALTATAVVPNAIARRSKPRPVLLTVTLPARVPCPLAPIHTP